jgi:alpha-glucosidase (family GH31 glycosyl hydrolase)
MRSSLTLMMNAGMAGYPISHNDVGGSKTTDEGGRTRKLLQHWNDLSAFSEIVTRTHPLPDSLHVWDDF